jgi:hypothetical protein
MNIGDIWGYTMVMNGDDFLFKEPTLALFPWISVCDGGSRMMEGRFKPDVSTYKLNDHYIN